MTELNFLMTMCEVTSAVGGVLNIVEERDKQQRGAVSERSQRVGQRRRCAAWPGIRLLPARVACIVLLAERSRFR